MTAELAAAIRALVEAVIWDENRSGGLLSRETLRKASELVVLIEAEAAAKLRI